MLARHCHNDGTGSESNLGSLGFTRLAPSLIVQWRILNVFDFGLVYAGPVAARRNYIIDY